MRTQIIHAGRVYRRVITALQKEKTEGAEKLKELYKYLTGDDEVKAIELAVYNPEVFIDWLYRWSGLYGTSRGGSVHTYFYGEDYEPLKKNNPTLKKMYVSCCGDEEDWPDIKMSPDEILKEHLELLTDDELHHFLYNYTDSDVHFGYYEAVMEGGSHSEMFIQDKEAPAWIHMELEDRLKNEWILHFTDPKNVVKIQHEGFTRGFTYPQHLGKTKWHWTGEKDTGGGYAFGYTLEDYPEDMYYPEGGRRWLTGVILCRADALYVEHLSDRDHQAVFWGPDAKDIVALMPIYDKGGGEWMYNVLTCDEEPIVVGRTLDEAVKWVVQNVNKYRDLLVCR